VVALWTMGATVEKLAATRIAGIAIDLMMQRFFALAFMFCIPLAARRATKVDKHLRAIFFRR
jgi:hypothetical protein